MTPYGGIEYVNKSDEKSLMFQVIFLLVEFIYTFHMPLFMGISGYCFSLSRKRSFIELFKQKFWRLIVPFLVVSVFYSIPIRYVIGYWNGSSDIVRDILLGQFLLMGNTHLWFVMSLFWIFIICHFINRVESKLGRWIIVFVLHLIGVMYLQYNGTNILGIPMGLKFLLYFFLGFNYMESVREYYNRYKLIPCVLCFIGLFVISSAWQFFIRFFDFPVATLFYSIIMAIAGCILFLRMCETWGGRFSKIHILRDNTFELYLYSDPINYLIIYVSYELLGKEIFSNSFLSISMFVLRFILSTIVAILIIQLVKVSKIKKLKML